ncbi:MAG: hypothetical protein PETM_01989 [Petrimonas sp.]|jgi:hypothetical protein
MLKLRVLRTCFVQNVEVMTRVRVAMLTRAREQMLFY